MAVPYGRWELCWGSRKMPDCAERQEGSLKQPCPQPSRSQALAHGHSACSACRRILRWFPGDRAIQGHRNTLANRLLDIYERSSPHTWHWFEKSLSYSNARLPQALIAGRMAQ